jgi:hypothetical protein
MILSLQGGGASALSNPENGMVDVLLDWQCKKSLKCVLVEEENHLWSREPSSHASPSLSSWFEN